jgi:hypothetical protein
VPDPDYTPEPVAATFTAADGTVLESTGTDRLDAFRNLVREAVAARYPNAPTPEADRRRADRRRADG